MYTYIYTHTLFNIIQVPSPVLWAVDLWGGGHCQLPEWEWAVDGHALGFSRRRRYSQPSAGQVYIHHCLATYSRVSVYSSCCVVCMDCAYILCLCLSSFSIWQASMGICLWSLLIWQNCFKKPYLLFGRVLCMALCVYTVDLFSPTVSPVQCWTCSWTRSALWSVVCLCCFFLVCHAAFCVCSCG